MEIKSWFGLFCDADVVLTSVGSCTLFIADLVLVFVFESCSDWSA